MIAAHEGRNETLDSTRLFRLHLRVQKLIDRERLTLAFDLDRVQCLKRECSSCQTVSGLAHKNLSCFCRVLKTRGDVDRVPHHRVAHPQITPYISRDDQPGVHTDVEI